MQQLTTLTALFLALATALPVLAQTKPQPAKAPASKSATRLPASGQSTQSNLNRGNLPALPAKTTPPSPPPKPQPVAQKPAPKPIAVRQPRHQYSWGLAFQKGDNLLNIGVGLSSYYYGNPLGISFEVGVDRDFSVGGQLDYNSGNYGDNYYNSSRWRYTATYIGARGSYHFNRILNLNTRKIDLYAGVGLGYRSFRWNDTNYGSGYDYRSGLFFNYYLGGKYYFNDKIGAFLELGYTGLSSSRIGLSVKF